MKIFKLYLIATIIFFGFSKNIYGQYDSLFFDGMQRYYLVHLPTNFDSSQNIKYPLVLVLHGGFGNAYNIEDQSKFSEKCDTAKVPFIVVYPEGVKSPLGISSWNGGGCCGYASSNNIDDVGFISSLLDTLESKFNIDENRIYSSGMSNGGIMSYRLAIELNNRIAAIGPVASDMAYEDNFSISRSVPIIHFHSFADSSVPYLGGIGDGVANYDFQPIDSTLNIWANLEGCGSLDTLFFEEGKYIHKIWSPCNDNSDIELYVTYDGGHSWPEGNVPRLGGDPVSQQLNATDLMWDFFIAHPKNNITQIENAKMQNYNFQLFQNYPNPFNPVTIIKYVIPSEVRSEKSKFKNILLEVFDILGREIKTLIDEKQTSGNYEVKFDGSKYPSGVYFYKLQMDGNFQIKKMILLK